LRLPSLRDRREDIPLLITHFLDRLEQMTEQKKTLTDEAMELLMKHDWPGNVRELENCLERFLGLQLRSRAPGCRSAHGLAIRQDP
jgi:DNA-binding NtrC family response regulator